MSQGEGEIRIDAEVLKYVPRTCGDCNLCCDVMGVPALGKPRNTRCVHGGGPCAIHDTWPAECLEFRCAWLAGLLPPEMKPDKIHAFVIGLGDDVDGIGVHCDPAYPGAWADEPLATLMEDMRQRGLQVLIGVDAKRYQLFGEKQLVKRESAA